MSYTREQIQRSWIYI